METPPSGERSNDLGTASVNWGSIVLFYAVACALSSPNFWFRDVHREAWLAWNVPGFLKGWAPAMGPALGAAAALWTFRKTHRRTVSLLGSCPARSFLFLGLTLFALLTLGVGSDEPPLPGLLEGASFVVYALREEMGWRGFLQDALRPLPEFQRYVLIGLLWGAWHFTSITGGSVRAAVIRHLWLIPVWILGSWGIGSSVEHTGSLMVAALLHLVFNFFRHLPPSTALPVLGFALLGWVFLIRIWPPRAIPETEVREMIRISSR